MALSEKIVAARKRKGLTQEQLADAANVTVRTIQRIESGETAPRAFTLKTIAAALDIDFETLGAGNDTAAMTTSPGQVAAADEEEGKHFLLMICLSCFSYLIIPLLHFLVPAWLLTKNRIQNPHMLAFARKLVRGQLFWVAGLLLLLLVTMAYNLGRAAYYNKTLLLNYLWPFLLMYVLNGVVILVQVWRIQKTDFRNTAAAK
jgi:XRE family transcriptional regulator, regulator of sulfur utilization